MTTRIMKCGFAALVVVTTMIMTGCAEASSTSHTYRLEFTVTGAESDPLDITVRDESADTELTAVTDATTPWTYTHSGEIDHSNLRVVSISALVSDLGADESYSVEAVYTNESYTEPKSYTVIDESEHNTTGSPQDFVIRRTIMLPYTP